MFAYPVGTGLYSRMQQGRLEERFTSPEIQTAYTERRIRSGDGLRTLRIPKLDVDVLVAEGTTPAALRAGAGHYVDSPLPGGAGDVAIAGHRTTYGRPFNRIDELEQSDVVALQTPLARHTYKVVPGFHGHPHPWLSRLQTSPSTRVKDQRAHADLDDVPPEGQRPAAPDRPAGAGQDRPDETRRDRRRLEADGAGRVGRRPTAVEVTLPVPGNPTAEPVDRLTLTACQPTCSAKQRRIVRAKLPAQSNQADCAPVSLSG